MNRRRIDLRRAGRKARAIVTRSPVASLIFHVSFMLLAFALIVLAFASSAHAQFSRVPKPTILIEKSGRCVADKDTMRRQHMNFLLHERDRTVRQGVRGEKYSLSDCIECHASPQNKSVIGTKDNFCESCHDYVGIRLDCFECHSPRPRSASGPRPNTAERAGLASLARTTEVRRR